MMIRTCGHYNETLYIHIANAHTLHNLQRNLRVLLALLQRHRQKLIPSPRNENAFPGRLRAAREKLKN